MTNKVSNKKVVIILFTICAFFIFPSTTKAQTQELILYERQYVKFSHDGNKIGDFVEYYELTNIEVANEQNEIVSKRTPNTKFFNDNSARIESYNKYFYDNGLWLEVVGHNVLKTTYDSINKSFDYLPLGYVPNKWINAAYAQASYEAGAGDSAARYNNSTNWDTAHDDTNGDEVNSEIRIETGKLSGGQYSISRGFIPFDTSALADDITISSTSLHLYNSGWFTNNDNDGDDFLVLIEGLQNDKTQNVIATDYDTCGTINSPDELSARTDFDSIVENGWTSFLLTDLTVVSLSDYTSLCIREGHDVIDTPYAGANNTFNGLYFETSADANPGYLMVEWSEPEPEPEASTTVSMLSGNYKTVIASSVCTGTNPQYCQTEYVLPLDDYIPVAAVMLYFYITFFIARKIRV